MTHDSSDTAQDDRDNTKLLPLGLAGRVIVALGSKQGGSNKISHSADDKGSQRSTVGRVNEGLLLRGMAVTFSYLQKSQGSLPDKKVS